MTITKKELTNKIADKLGASVTQPQVAAVIDMMMSTINEELVQGNEIVFRNFGTFKVTTTKAKIGRNPKKPGEEVMIPETRKVKFKVGKQLKADVAGSLMKD